MVDFLIQSPLEHHAQLTPDHPALVIEGRSLSYAELDSRSNQLANALVANGAVAQDRVGIFHHKELELGIAIYGTLKAGCVFVPLDPFMPAERLSFILQDCGITHIISSDQQKTVLAEVEKCNTLHIYGVENSLESPQTRWQDVYRLPDTNPRIRLIDQDLGYIMYTSGSTGQPKGMMHTHLGSVTYARWGVAYVDMKPDDRVASHAPLHFDLSIFDFFSTARAGATVVLVPESVTRFPASWTKTIEDERISIVFTVPFTLTSMLQQGAMGKRDLSSLRWIMFGGEPFPPRQLREITHMLSWVTFSNIYGPAEAPCCTAFMIPRPLPDSDEPLPIGTVSSNSAGLIIDHQGRECAEGEPGELCIRSSTLMKGYWNRPDLSESAFLTIDEPGRLPLLFYRTGDRVQCHEDGQLRFLGRMDRMVKTRGHRVELDEVEAVLSSCDDLSEVAAYTETDKDGNNLIMAAATAKADTQLDATRLLQIARSRLPAYAVPRDIKIIRQMPHTSSGKLNRRGLTRQWIEENEIQVVNDGQ